MNTNEQNELEQFRLNEPKKVAERDYWRDRARKAEAMVNPLLNHLQLCWCGKSAKYKSTDASREGCIYRCEKHVPKSPFDNAIYDICGIQVGVRPEEMWEPEDEWFNLSNDASQRPSDLTGAISKDANPEGSLH